ncbi:MAG TPA: SDR family NAD(P)-dependent oxidoreductase, partial [Pyrinomonadaceae bacterium]
MANQQQRREIEEFIARATGGGTSPEPKRAGRDADGQTGAAPEPIAVVGLSGYFPSCMSHQEFWRAIDEDRSLIEELPAGRFVLGQSAGPSDEGSTQQPSRWGGFIPDIESFDPEFFRMLPGEAELTDPQLRLLLMSVYHTLEDAGYAPQSLGKSRTGVFVGYEWNEYLQRLKAQGLTAPGFLGADSIIANQISYYLDLRGPSEVVNTMCSGAAVATHRAIRALRAGEIRQAVVGAVNLILNPDTHLSLSQMGQLSLEPTVRSFGKDAAGYLRGEAVASVLLKPLALAREDGDSVYALIVGSAVNFNGRGGTSISSPDIESHASLIKECYREAGIDVRHVTYVEAQGMGSQLTDIAEWEACNRALKSLAREQGVMLPAGGCRVSTLKPMTGHMHAASAFGALFKIIRSLQTDKVHKILGLTEINPHLDLEEQPCRLAAETVAWPETDHPRLAGLHSYGASGNNAHLLIQEYRREPLPPEREKGVHVVPFSARKPAQLRQLVSAVVAELAEHPAPSLAAVALTMQAGRDEMNHRAAFVADSTASLIEAAGLWLAQDGPAGVFYGAGAGPSTDAGGESAGAIAARWVAGESIVWPRPDNHRTLPRLHLPGYPFETVRCWYEAPPLGAQSSEPTADTTPADAPARASDAAPRTTAERQAHAEPRRDDQPRFAHAESIVRHLLSDFLKLGPQSLDLDRQFSELGFSSLLVIHLSAQLLQQHGVNLLPAKVFAQTSPRGLIRLVAETLGATPPAARESHASAEPDSNAHAFSPAKRSAKAETPARQEAGIARGADTFEPIAVIGVAGSYPDAPDLTQFWRNLSQGVHSVRELPAGRWPTRQYHERDSELAIKSGKYYAHRGGFLDRLNHFDSLFFNLSPVEAEYMHVKERLFMQCAWHALEDAGYTPAALKDETVGVFAGVSKAGLDSYKDSYFSLTNRVSYRFNFTGPSMPVDTACSSSLSALHEACLHIHSGDCTVALVGGVNAYTHPSAFTEFSRLRVMSPDGTTRAFGAQANGFVPGEGVGAVFLKRLSRAVEDGDNIYAVIRGTAINHGGKANGYTVPNPQAHQRLIRRALRKAGVSPRAVSYVEAHGTGTPLGDPVEIQGLTDAFRQETPDVGYCRIGSVKTNIGHLEAGAGIAGLTKILLQMKYKRLVPSLHSEEPNPHIDFSVTPFQVQQRAEEWRPLGPDGQPISRVACISSFGAGGSNAHAVVEEFVDTREAVEESAESRPALVVLSAKSEAALKTYARRLAQAVEADEQVDLRDLAFTLQVGREPMPYRLAFVAGSLTEVSAALEGFAVGENSVDVFFGHADGDSALPFDDEPDFVTLLNTWFVDGKLSKVAQAWVRGFAIEWSAGYGGRRPRRVSLPGYPFETEPFPVAPITVVAAEAAGSPPPQVIHPLLHRNISDMTRQCFSSTFSGDESFFSDHVVHGQKMLPGAAFLELARAAVEHSLPQSGGAENYVRLKNVIWAEPLVISGPPVTVETEVSTDDGGLRFEIRSVAGWSEDGRTIHARGGADLVATPERNPINLHDVARRFSSATLGAEECYRAFAEMGIAYGPAHRGIHRLLVGEEAGGRRQVLAEIVLPDAAAQPVSQLLLHPSILDSAFQSVLGFAYGAREVRAAIPFALDAIDIYQRLPPRVWALTRELGQISGREAMHRLALDLYDESGTLCLSVEGLTSRVPTIFAAEPSDRPLLFVPRWRRASTGETGRRTAFGAHLVLFCGVQKVSVEGAECRSVNLRGLSGDAAYETCLTSIFEVVREQTRRANAGWRLLVQVVVPDGGELGLLGGAAAFLKTAHLENPAFIGQLIKVAAGDSAQSIARQLAEAARLHDRPIVRYENDEPLVVEWQQRAWNVSAERVPWKGQGVYLIAGGAGGLGRLLALEIARRAADARLMLTGRTANNERIVSLLDELRARGAQAEYEAADVTNVDDVIRIVHSTRERFGALDGIIHCAGLTRDNYLPRKTAEELLHVLAPKVKGTLNLDAATKELPLDFFIMFSSAAAAVGHPAQADYAAANAFMDEFAAYRGRQVAEGRRRGLTLSINWALWQDGGMSLSAEQQQHLYRASGMEPIKTAEGLAALYQCMASGEPQVLVIAGDHARLIPHVTASPAAGGDGDTSERLLGVLRAEVARIIAVDSAEVDAHVKLEEYGLDAVQYAELIQRINEEFSLQLPPTALTEQETLAEFSSSLAAGLKQRPATRPEQAESPSRRGEITAAPAGDALAARVTEFLRELLSKEIKLPVARVKPNAPFEQYGINSLMIVQMTDTLEKTFGTLPKTLFFEYTTLASLATYFVDNYSHKLPDLLPAEQPEPPAANKTEPRVLTAQEKTRLPVSGSRLAPRKEVEHDSVVDAASPDDIAIIGVAGRYPQAPDLHRLWLNLRAGRDCVTEVPASRWDHARFFD